VLDHPQNRRIVVDFAGLPLDQPAPEAVVSVGDGAKLGGPVGVQPVAPLGVWRVVFELVPDGSGRPVELRCFLRHAQTTLSETWSHLWNP
jgi:glucans biosynthesis protein